MANTAIAALLASVNVKRDYKADWKENTKADFKTTWPAPTSVAAFVASAVTGNAGVTAISFTNNTTGAWDSVLWNFGDGTTSTLASPSHTYVAAGTFAVSLTVSGKGGTNTGTRAAYITIAA